MLNEMLHALGQPITALGMCRLLARLPESPDAQSLEDLADQVDRARDLYEALRLLLEGGGEWASAGGAVGRWQERVSPRRLRVYPGEYERGTDSRILEGVLGAAQRSCAPEEGGTVRVVEGWLEVEGGGALTSGVPWMLRVAEAVAAVEGAEVGMVYRLQPFHARVRLFPV